VALVLAVAAGFKPTSDNLNISMAGHSFWPAIFRLAVNRQLHAVLSHGRHAGLWLNKHFLCLLGGDTTFHRP
jgi:hypothetical protein